MPEPTEPVIPAEPTTEPTNPATPVAPVVPDPQGQKTPEELAADVEKWKSMARKHEDASKSKDERLKRLDEIEESQKTEAQKLIERAEKAEVRALELEVRAMRAEVASAKGVPANLITGSTKEEMEVAADALVAFKGKPVIPDTGGGTRGGNIDGQTAQLTQADLDKLTAEKRYDEIAAAQSAGRFSDLLSNKS